MSKSAIFEEDSSWAQTFITVTPQDDGFLREIEDSSTVSGNSDVPLNLDTWNIVLRKSLINTTKDLVDPRDLEKTERFAAECQTYLQGFPKVELPTIYKDEATQTLFIGKDEQRAFEKTFNDIITVMNEKPLPEWRKSQYVQTTITFSNETSLDDTIKKLEKDNAEESFEESDADAATVESSDLLNFLIDRTLWMTEPVSPSKIETKNAGIETTVKYNHVTKKLTIDHEVQTNLSCNPRHSNSMLLSEYNETKFFCKKQVNDCLNKVISPEMIINDAENMSIKDEEITDLQTKEQFIENNVQPQQKNKITSTFAYSLAAPKSQLYKRQQRQTKDILLVDNPPYAVRYQNEDKQNRNLIRACLPRTTPNTYNKSISSCSLNSDRLKSREKETSSSCSIRRTVHLSERDEKALSILKKSICRKETCPRRDKDSPLTIAARKNELKSGVKASSKSSDESF